MVNRGGVGAAFARGRAPIILVLLFLGGAVMLRHAVVSRQEPANTCCAIPSDVRAALAHLPRSFEPNQGQADSRIKFLARGDGYGVYFTPSETVLAFPHRTQQGASQVAVQMRLSGANQNSDISALHQLPGHSNYLIGKDPSGWHRNIPQFARVQYHDVYPGIDLRDIDRKSTRLNSSHQIISYAVFCLKKKNRRALSYITLYGQVRSQPVHFYRVD